MNERKYHLALLRAFIRSIVKIGGKVEKKKPFNSIHNKQWFKIELQTNFGRKRSRIM